MKENFPSPALPQKFRDGNTEFFGESKLKL
jgi:hypothetical protein